VTVIGKVFLPFCYLALLKLNKLEFEDAISF